MNNPLITATAIGCRRLAPSPNPISIGTKPKIAVKVVINIGRIRCLPALIIALRLSKPSSYSWLILSTRIMELFTAIPPSIIIPIIEMIFSGVPRIKKVKIEPTNANGMVNRIVKG